jgi:hypothetical protein
LEQSSAQLAAFFDVSWSLSSLHSSFYSGQIKICF